MELINEHADSDETKCCVAEYLLEQFDTKEQDGWVMLVGNGNTAEHQTLISCRLKEINYFSWRLAQCTGLKE